MLQQPINNRYAINPYYQKYPVWHDQPCYAFTNPDILTFHQTLTGYHPTPCHSLKHLAKSLGIQNIMVKDESHRFGIKAFKGLGASYAIYRFLKSEWESRFSEPFGPHSFSDHNQLKKLGAYTFCAATDGNHGRAVAWTAKMLGQKAVIYMPDDTVDARVNAIESEGAKTILVKGTFDDCVNQADRDAKQNHWQVIADTAYEGNMQIPQYIMAGYSTLFKELDPSIQPDIVFLQAGVGGLAAAGSWHFTQLFKENRPKLIGVEPLASDCFLESIAHGNGTIKPATGQQNSLMAGLNCGVPSLVAWPICRDAIDLFLAISDDYAKQAMQTYYYPKGDDPQIISGESGASGLAGLLAFLTDPLFSQAKTQLNVTPNSTILVINTEGDTDPKNFKKITTI